MRLGRRVEHALDHRIATARGFLLTELIFDFRILSHAASHYVTFLKI
jgi:hypothetical protein